LDLWRQRYSAGGLALQFFCCCLIFLKVFGHLPDPFQWGQVLPAGRQRSLWLGLWWQLPEKI
jgi:hypothetical protein